MAINQALFILGFLGGVFEILLGVTRRKSVVQKAAWISLILSGVFLVLWSIMGELLYWHKLRPDYALIKAVIGGMAAGIIMNMLLSRQLVTSPNK